MREHNLDLSIVWILQMCFSSSFSHSGCETLDGTVIHDNSCHGDKACDKGALFYFQPELYDI